MGLLSACGELGFQSKDASSSLSALVCESQLKKVFSETLHPWLSANNRCYQCHSTTQGSKDLNVAYNTVMQKGDSVIFDYASNGHNGLNSAQIESEIDSFRPRWDNAKGTYTDCLSSSTGSQSNLKPEPKLAPNIDQSKTNPNAWQKITWDLETDVPTAQQGKFGAVMSIEVKYNMANGQVQGYEYRNPTFNLKSSGKKFRVQGLSIWINGTQQTSTTTYLTLNRVIESTTPVNFAPNWSSALAVYPLANNTDTHSIEVVSIDETLDNDPGDPSSGGGGEFELPDTVTWTQLTSADPTMGVFNRHCIGCHNASNQRQPILSDYQSAFTNGNLIYDATHGGLNGALEMPPNPGSFGQLERDLIRIWIESGKPQ